MFSGKMVTGPLLIGIFILAIVVLLLLRRPLQTDSAVLWAVSVW